MERTRLQGRPGKRKQKQEAQQIQALLTLAEQFHRNEPATALAYASTACDFARAQAHTALLVSALCMKGQCCVVSSDYQPAIECFTEAISLCENELHDDSEKYSALHLLGTVYERTGRYNEAIQIFSSCLEYWEPRHNSADRTVNVLNSIGIIYKNLEDFEKALGCYKRCMQILGEEESLRTAKMLLNIGNVYVRNNAPQQGIEFYRKAQAIAARIGDDYVLNFVLINIGNAHVAMKEYEAALEYFRQALETADKYGVETKLAIMVGISDIYVAMNDYEQALPLLQEVAALAGQAGIRRRQIYALGSIGTIICRRGDPERALEILHHALALAEEAGLLYHQYHLYKFLATTCEAYGEIPKAYEWYKRYSNMREKMLDEEKQKALAEMQTRFEVERMEQQNEIYRLRTRELERELSSRSNELASLILRLTEKNEMLQTMRREIVRHRGAAETGGAKLMAKLLTWIDSNLDAEATWAAFEQQFNQIHHGFLHKLSERCPRLTTTELRVCSLLKIQLASKDIAAMLSLSPRTVETHRYNIRKKLQLDTPAHLATFLSSL